MFTGDSVPPPPSIWLEDHAVFSSIFIRLRPDRGRVHNNNIVVYLSWFNVFTNRPFAAPASPIMDFRIGFQHGQQTSAAVINARANAFYFPANRYLVPRRANFGFFISLPHNMITYSPTAVRQANNALTWPTRISRWDDCGRYAHVLCTGSKPTAIFR